MSVFAAAAIASGVYMRAIKSSRRRSGGEQKPSTTSSSSNTDSMATIIATHAQLMGANERWPLSADKGALLLLHSAIRDDVEQIHAALANTLHQLKSGRPLAQWQAAAWATYFAEFHRAMRRYIQVEEDLIQPWVPQWAATPHAGPGSSPSACLATLEQLRGLFDALALEQQRPAAASSGSSSVFNVGDDGSDEGEDGTDDEDEEGSAPLHRLLKASASFEAMREQLLVHLAEEDRVVVPLLRRHLSWEQEAVPEKVMMRSLQPIDVAYLCRTRKTDAERRQVMTWLGIPAHIQEHVMLPAIRRYNSTLISLVHSLQAGQPAAPAKPEPSVWDDGVSAWKSW